ncbi:MAG: hypothetical protein V1905_03780 [bacterium]
MSRFDKIFIAIAIVASLVAFTAILFPHLCIVLWAKVSFSQDKQPELYRTPLEMEVKPANYQVGKYFEVEHANLSLKTPWRDLVKRYRSDLVYKLTYTGDKSLMIVDNRQLPTFLETLNQEKFDSSSIDKILNYYGTENIENNKSFFKLILKTTPAEISFKTPAKEAVVKSTLLVLKKALLGVHKTKDGDIYMIKTGAITAFQYGNPQADKEVTINVFGEGKNNWLLIVGNVTQEEIDYILGSLAVK